MYSQELLSRTTSVGTSAHSDIDSISRYVGEGGEISRLKPVSAKKLYFMVKPDWICGLLGTFGAVAGGAEMPLFALGVTQALVSYYSDWETTKAEVKKITLLFTGGAVIAFFVHFLAHFNFGIMGERLTLRVRERMFRGKQSRNFYEQYNKTLISMIWVHHGSHAEERDRVVRREGKRQRHAVGTARSGCHAAENDRCRPVNHPPPEHGNDSLLVDHRLHPQLEDNSRPLSHIPFDN